MDLIFNTTIKNKNQVINCDCVNLVEDNISNAWNATVVLLELRGSPSVTRAIWAHLVKNRQGDRIERTDIIVETGSEQKTVSVFPKTKFITATIGESYIIMDARFGNKQRVFFPFGDVDTPSPFFMESMRINVPDVPLLNEWKDKIWTMAIREGGISPLNSFGTNLNIWRINQSAKWKDFIKEEIKSWHN